MGKAPETPSLFNRLPSDLGLMAGKAYQFVATIGEEALELIITLWILIMVERTYGQQGVGIYSYLMALLFIARYTANFGVARHVEHEIAIISRDGPQRQQLITSGFQTTVITSLTTAILLLVTAGFDTAHTRIEERLVAYLIIGLILPIANLNHFKLSILQGLGRHTRVAHLRTCRYGVLLGFVWVLTRLHIPPSYLLLAYLLSETFMVVMVRRHLKLPGFKTVFQHPRHVVDTLKRGNAYLFTDNGLDVLLNLDLFVLGLFVSAWDLGVYAEAAVIVRFFLVIPAGIKPIFRRRYNKMAAQEATTALHALVRRRTSVLFSLHAILAVCVLLTYPAVLNFFFHTRGEEMLSFRIFSVFVPGLIFYGAFYAQDSLYEAVGQVAHLRRLTMITSGINVVLAFYLVPVAGFYGAALATMITMLLYFALFGRDLTPPIRIDKTTYMVAGLAVYLVYTLFEGWDMGTTASTWLAPLLLWLLFYLIGMFGVATRPADTKEASA
jgi:O-antigen/teichoic acid export membrane protein